MITDLHLYVDSQARQFVKGPQSNTAFRFPPVYQGDTLNLFLHGVAPNTDPANLDVYQEAPIAFSGIKCGLGLGADAAPSGGTFKIQLVGQTETTAALDFDADQPTVLAALNALASVQAVSARGIRLDLPTPAAPNFFLIRWVDPSVTALFEFAELSCEPLCFPRSSVQPLAYGQIQILKYIVAPYCFADQFVYPSADPATTAGIRDGTGRQNCVQSLAVPHDAMGSLSLTFASNTTSLLTVADVQGATDGSSEISAALNGLYSDGLTRFNVTRDAPGVYYVEMVGPLAKTDFPVLAVTMHGQEPLDTPQGSLPLTGSDLELALHGQKQLTLLFELEITDGARVATIQAAVTVVNDMIDDAMALEGLPAWLNPSSPTYVAPGSTAPTITAPAASVTPIGTGTASGTSSTDYVVTHNLATLDVLVEVRDAYSRLRLPDNQYTCTILDVDRVEVVFQAAPTQPNQYVVIIAAVIPVKQAFPPDLTITIPQVTGLQDILNALLNGINPDAPISAKNLPTRIPWYNYDADGNAAGYRFDPVPLGLLPTVGFPFIGGDGGWYITLPGPPPVTVQLLDPTGHIPVDTLPLDPASWPGLVNAIAKALQSGAPLPPGYIPIVIPTLAGVLLPPLATLRPGAAAVIPTLPRALPAYTTTESVSGALPLPSAAAANTVAVVSGSASAAAVKYRAPQFFRDGQQIGCDGRQQFPVFTVGANAYPREMEQELFTLHVAPNMLGKNCQFLAVAQLTLALTGPAAAYVRAQYVLSVQFGHTNGALLSSVSWDSAPITETLLVSDAAVTHVFGLRVLCDKITGALTALSNLYGREVACAAPASGSFVVRASLTQFDLEDVPFAAGQVAVSLKGISSVIDLAQINA